MTAYGFTLMTEQHGPKELLLNAEKGEEAGFSFLVMSDHFHPWLDVQGNAPFAWSVLGAVADRTERVELMTMVTCPFLRYHPAVVAQSAATVQIMADGRFTLGLGAGENLNEHVVGAGWPPADVRHEMLAESIDIVRALWDGGFRSYQGEHLTLQDARLYTLPERLPRIAVAAGGREAAELAGGLGDDLVATAPDASLVQAYRDAGGKGRTFGQIPLCWAPTEDQARKTAVEQWSFGVHGWKVMAELPNPVNFEAVAKTVREDDVAELVPCGPDVAAHVDGITKFVDAGFDHVAVVQVGEDQDGFLRFWREELAGALPR
jgi:G6PDH family F420-dependent oxidoreductase